MAEHGERLALVLMTDIGWLAFGTPSRWDVFCDTAVLGHRVNRIAIIQTVTLGQLKLRQDADISHHPIQHRTPHRHE